MSTTTDSYSLQPSNKGTSSMTTATTGIDTASLHQPLTTAAATITTTNDTRATSEGMTIEKGGESHTGGERGALVTDNISSLISNSLVTIQSDTIRPDDINPQCTNNVNTSSITDSQSTSIIQSNTTSLFSTPPLSQATPTPLINTITISHSEDESSDDKEKGSFLPIDMADISGMRFELEDSEEKSFEITSLHSSSPGSDHAHLSLNSNPPGEEEEEEGEILSVDDLEIEEKEGIEKRLEEDKVEAYPEDVFQDGGHNPHSSRLLSSSSSSSDAHRYLEDRISLSVDDRLSPPTPQKTPPTSNMLSTSTTNPNKEKRNFFSLEEDKSTSARFDTIDIRIDSEDISRESDGEIGFEVKTSEITSNNYTSTGLNDDISISHESLKKKKKRLLNRDFTKHSQSRTVSTAITSPPSSTVKQPSTQIKERSRDKSHSKHSASTLHVHHVETKHRHHRHRHRHHGDRLTTPPSRHEQHGGSSERKGHHKSPRPRPHVGEEQLSPHRSHTHNRMKRHSPSEDRTHHKKTSHAHSSAHYHHDHNHCSGRSHSSTPVSDHYESGRVFDKPHPHRTKDSSPSWNSDGPEDGRMWSHHHGDHRKRRGSEGSGEDVKYKKRKHHKMNHDESRYYNKEHQPTSVPY